MNFKEDHFGFIKSIDSKGDLSDSKRGNSEEKKPPPPLHRYRFLSDLPYSHEIGTQETPKDDEDIERDDVPLTPQASSIDHLEAAYNEANTVDQKIKIIIKAIKFYYPKINFRVEGSAYVALQKDPLKELTKWVLKLDRLYVQYENNPNQSIKILESAYFNWLKLLASFKKNEIELEIEHYCSLALEEKLEFLIKYDFKNYLSKAALKEFNKLGNSPSGMSAATEIEKWRSKCLELKIKLETSSCCCFIL